MRSRSILGSGGGSELLYSGALPLNWIEEYYQRLDRNRVKMMEKSARKKILQIMPAEGWEAVYVNEGKPIFTNLVCWALVEEGEDTFVAGLDSSLGSPNFVDFVEDLSNFLGYKSPNDDKDWLKEAAEFQGHPN
jgi:hypothetical protein